MAVIIIISLQVLEFVYDVSSGDFSSDMGVDGRGIQVNCKTIVYIYSTILFLIRK